MPKIIRVVYSFTALLIILILTGCQPLPNEAVSNNTANTGTATPLPIASATPAMTSSADERGLPVTLPVVDALFYNDEGFAQELRQRLQLSDEQVERLKAVAREETAKLRESEGDEYAGSTQAALTSAKEQIQAVIGEEKLNQFAALVRQRWMGGGAGTDPRADASATANRPNAVPTDTRIVVNAPAYRMDVFENGQLTKTYNIGIGYPEFPLPVGLRKAETIIYNPTWTPPDEPWVEASGKVKVGQKVPAGSRLNPLGPVKIPIGLPSLIHGGKSPAKLGSFASHGCVGLTNSQVLEFARTLAQLGGTEVTDEQITEYLKKKTETKNVKLGQPIPVELRYETIVVEDGKVYVYRDVYDRGTNTEENLRAVLQAHGISFDQLSAEEQAQLKDALRLMARDATGKPADAIPNATPTPTPGRSSGKKKENVTRTVKGQKQIIVEIAALRGKGYPAPVNLNAGAPSKGTATAPGQRASKRQGR